MEKSTTTTSLPLRIHPAASPISPQKPSPFPTEEDPTMQGIKRSHDGVKKESEEAESVSPFMPMFEVFRNELDEHHDRRERIIKASRDITAASKKIIFALQRVRTLNTPIPAKILSETTTRATAMHSQFSAIVPDLTDLNTWRYQRQISGGIQEYIEAISFQHYLTTQTLIPLPVALASLPPGIVLTGDDYVLGIFDLVGELMRFAITAMATTGALPGGEEVEEEGGGKGRDILMDMRALRVAFQGLDTGSCGGTGLGKDVEKKMEVMRTCVEKVETAVYGMIIRGRERPMGWVPDLKDEGGGGGAARGVESY